jgi:hypothetical protein
VLTILAGCDRRASQPDRIETTGVGRVDSPRFRSRVVSELQYCMLIHDKTLVRKSAGHSFFYSNFLLFNHALDENSKIALDFETDGGDLPPSYISNTTKKRAAFRVLISLCVFFAFISAVLARLLYTGGTVCIDKGLATELGTSPLVIVKIGGA